jgi:NTE family protein
MAKKALVISGGGCKGAFAVGVIKNLAANFPDISFDIFVGTSTGSLITPFALLDEIALLEQLYTTTTTDNIITKGNVITRLLGDNSLFDAKPLGNLIKQYYDDNRCNKILQSQKELYLATTCLQTGTAVYFTTKDAPLVTDYEVLKINNSDELRRAVMASSCQPVFMPPIEIKKGAVPLRQYVDGGVREYAGIQLAIDAGADEIYTILLSPEKDIPEEKTFNDAFGILSATIDIFTTDVGSNDVRVPMLYNRALKYINSVQQKMKKAGVAQNDIDDYFNIPFNNPFTGKKPLKIYVIRPDAPLGGGPGGLDFDPNEMKGMLAKGRKSIDDFMANLQRGGGPDV